MKILYVSQYFYPEIFRGNDIAFHLASKGHDVTVITGIPNYPQGTFFHGYGLFKNNTEIIHNVKVIRIPLVPRGNGGLIRLLLNYFSFAFFASVFCFFYAFVSKFDKIFVQQLSPVTMSIPAIIVKKIQKISIYLWVLDLWPESLVSASGTNNKVIIKFFNFFVKLQYKNSKRILISSEGFRNSIITKGNFAEKIIYFPNWAESIFTTFKEENIPVLPSGFLVMFAGNIGEAQDFENIMKATQLLANEKSIHFIFVGTGRKKEWANRYVEENKLEETVHFIGHFPLSYMPSFFSKASIMLISLKNELIFNLTVPAKLQAYMATGKPIIGMLNGDGAKIIKDAKCGIAVDASNYKLLAKSILKMKAMSQKELGVIGNNGKLYCNEHFNKIKCLNNLSKII